MNTIKQIEDAVRELPPKELKAFRAWFATFDAKAWDRQFEKDVAGGRLDKIGQKALEDLKKGRCTER